MFMTHLLNFLCLTHDYLLISAVIIGIHSIHMYFINNLSESFSFPCPLSIQLINNYFHLTYTSFLYSLLPCYSISSVQLSLVTAGAAWPSAQPRLWEVRTPRSTSTPGRRGWWRRWGYYQITQEDMVTVNINAAWLSGRQHGLVRRLCGQQQVDPHRRPLHCRMVR